MPLFHALRLEDHILNFSVTGKHESIVAFLMTELCAECIVKDFTVIHQIENLFKGGYNWIDLWTLCKGDKSLTVSLKSIPFGNGSPDERTLMSKYSTLISTNNGRIIFHRICQLQNCYFHFLNRCNLLK